MNKNTKMASAVGAGLILLAGGAGTAMAATTQAPTASHAPATQSQADPMKAKLDALVKSGKITSAQESAILSAMPAHPAGKGDMKPGFGGPRMGGQGGSLIKDAATAIGVSTSSLEASLKSGKSIEQVAAAKGISEATLISKIQAAQASSLKTALEAQRGTDAMHQKAPVAHQGQGL